MFVTGDGDDFVCRTQLGRTALIRATESGRIECVRALYENGADTKAKNNVRPIMFLMRFSQFFLNIF